MIIVDTSIWIDHLAVADPIVAEMLTEMNQRVHPFVIGELAVGSIRNRQNVIAALADMPQAAVRPTMRSYA